MRFIYVKVELYVWIKSVFLKKKKKSRKLPFSPRWSEDEALKPKFSLLRISAENTLCQITNGNSELLGPWHICCRDLSTKPKISIEFAFESSSALKVAEFIWVPCLGEHSYSLYSSCRGVKRGTLSGTEIYSTSTLTFSAELSLRLKQKWKRMSFTDVFNTSRRTLFMSSDSQYFPKPFNQGWRKIP